VQKRDYIEFEGDLFGSEDGEYFDNFLDGLQNIANALNEASEKSVEGGAGFHWEIKIIAKGVWA